jgi:predicted transcriptional regulator
LAVRKVTVNLPEETVETLRSLAKERNITYTEALKRAIENEKFLHDEQERGTAVLLESPDRPTREVIFR